MRTTAMIFPKVDSVGNERVLPYWRPFLVATAAMLVLTACSTDKGVGGTIVLSTSADADILFPPLTLTLQGRQVLDQIFDNLADIGPSLNTVGDVGFTPRLADRWQWGADSLSISFHINPRARWHDGVPVGAEDVKFTFQLVKDTSLASPLASNLDNVDSVSVHDSLTAVVWFHQRAPDMFFKAASPVAILPAHLLSKIAPADIHQSGFARAPVGSGRFRFGAWDRGSRIMIRADSTNYRGRPTADRAIWLLAADYPAASVRFLSGTADFLDVVKPELIPQVKAKGADIIVSPGSLDYGYAAFNLRNASNTGPHPIFGDRETRRALVMAVDRSAIVGNVFDTLGLVAHGPATRIMPTNDTTIGIPYDPQRSARTLDSLGWKRGPDGVRAKDGKRLKMVYQTSINASRQKTQQVVKQAAGKAGIDMEIKSVTASVYFSSDPANLDTYPHFSTDIQMYTTTMTQPDPELFMIAFTSWEVSSKENKWQGRNIPRWRNEEYDKLYKASEGELDPVKRAGMYIKMNDLAIQNVVVIPVVWRPRVRAIASKLRLEQSGWDSDFWNLQHWYREA